MGLEPRTELTFENYMNRLRPSKFNEAFHQNAYWFYSDERGKIQALKGIAHAQTVSKLPQQRIDFAVTEGTQELESRALSRFKGLVHIIRQLNNTEGVRERLKRLVGAYERDATLATEDRELYIPFAQFFAAHYDKLAPLYERAPPEFLIVGDVSKKQVADFKQRKDAKFYGLAESYLFAIQDMLYALSVRRKKNIDLRHANEGLQALQRQFVDETSPLSAKDRHGLELYHLNHLVQKGVDFGNDAPTPAQAQKAYSLGTWYLSRDISATLNRSVERLLMNAVNCCIAGPNGKSKEASLLHWLDPAVHIWDIAHCAEDGLDKLSQPSHTIGTVICVETTGHHASTPDQVERYLVLEGFPMNANAYAVIAHVNPSPLSKELDFHNRYSLPALAYTLGLKAAKLLKISKMFVNAEHTGRQRSVEDTVREAALAATSEQGAWKFKDGKFSLRKDLRTQETFAQARFGTVSFAYTHVLSKPPFDPSLTRVLRNDPLWEGEGYFDTWYRWNKFIGDSAPTQLEEICASHPYAQSVWARAQARREQGLHPESFWNLGIGYCTGIEVDVEKECARLQIK